MGSRIPGTGGSTRPVVGGAVSGGGNNWSRNLSAVVLLGPSQVDNSSSQSIIPSDLVLQGDSLVVAARAQAEVEGKTTLSQATIVSSELTTTGQPEATGRSAVATPLPKGEEVETVSLLPESERVIIETVDEPSILLSDINDHMMDVTTGPSEGLDFSLFQLTEANSNSAMTTEDVILSTERTPIDQELDSNMFSNDNLASPETTVEENSVRTVITEAHLRNKSLEESEEAKNKLIIVSASDDSIASLTENDNVAMTTEDSPASEMVNNLISLTSENMATITEVSVSGNTEGNVMPLMGDTKAYSPEDNMTVKVEEIATHLLEDTHLNKIEDILVTGTEEGSQPITEVTVATINEAVQTTSSNSFSSDFEGEEKGDINASDLEDISSTSQPLETMEDFTDISALTAMESLDNDIEDQSEKVFITNLLPGNIDAFSTPEAPPNDEKSVVLTTARTNFEDFTTHAAMQENIESSSASSSSGDNYVDLTSSLPVTNWVGALTTTPSQPEDQHVLASNSAVTNDNSLLQNETNSTEQEVSTLTKDTVTSGATFVASAETSSVTSTDSISNTMSSNEVRLLSVDQQETTQASLEIETQVPLKKTLVNEMADTGHTDPILEPDLDESNTLSVESELLEEETDKNNSITYESIALDTQENMLLTTLPTAFQDKDKSITADSMEVVPVTQTVDVELDSKAFAGEKQGLPLFATASSRLGTELPESTSNMVIENYQDSTTEVGSTTASLNTIEEIKNKDTFKLQNRVPMPRAIANPASGQNILQDTVSLEPLAKDDDLASDGLFLQATNCSTGLGCDSGRVCLDRQQVCDGLPDCTDGRDETEVICSRPASSCQEDEFPCLKGRCIPQAWKCDGRPDCSRGEDELACMVSCPSGQFLCKDGRCLPNSLKCDGRQDCGAGEDEVSCTNQICS
jgi:hypothetical protein